MPCNSFASCSACKPHPCVDTQDKMSQNRLPVVPTVSVLAVMKSRLQGAVRGHSLLKKKADALTVRCVIDVLWLL